MRLTVEIAKVDYEDEPHARERKPEFKLIVHDATVCLNAPLTRHQLKKYVDGLVALLATTDKPTYTVENTSSISHKLVVDQDDDRADR